MSNLKGLRCDVQQFVALKGEKRQRVNYPDTKCRSNVGEVVMRGVVQKMRIFNQLDNEKVLKKCDVFSTPPRNIKLLVLNVTLNPFPRGLPPVLRVIFTFSL
jgi:hypothetical protein